MSLIRSLRIRLGRTDVGSLFGLEDGRVYFRFDDRYASDPRRPILSCLYVAPGGTGPAVAATTAQLLDPALAVNRGDGRGGLPPFFQNLLPEGQLRAQLVAELGIDRDDEFSLLAACGADLPGDVWALSESLDQPALGRLLGQGYDSYEMSSMQAPTPDQMSLSGIQPKIGLVADAAGRYVMRSRLHGGEHFIGKLPASDLPRLPEVEYTSMQLARAAGVHTCEVALRPLSLLSERLPFALLADERNFLLVSRYDRDVDTPTRRRHAEDFAQVTGMFSEDKYRGTYAAIGQALLMYSTQAEQDILELMRRIKVCELLGNYDAHLKNFGLLYDPATGRPALSPAYDIVAYALYYTGRGHALKFLPDQRNGPVNLTPSIVRQLSNVWGVPEKRLSRAVADTVDAAMSNWPALIEQSPLTSEQKTSLLGFARANVSSQAWARRHPAAPA